MEGDKKDKTKSDRTNRKEIQTDRQVRMCLLGGQGRVKYIL